MTENIAQISVVLTLDNQYELRIDESKSGIEQFQTKNPVSIQRLLRKNETMPAKVKSYNGIMNENGRYIAKLCSQKLERHDDILGLQLESDILVEILDTANMTIQLIRLDVNWKTFASEGVKEVVITRIWNLDKPNASHINSILSSHQYPTRAINRTLSLSSSIDYKRFRRQSVSKYHQSTSSISDEIKKIKTNKASNPMDKFMNIFLLVAVMSVTWIVTMMLSLSIFGESLIFVCHQALGIPKGLSVLFIIGFLSLWSTYLTGCITRWFTIPAFRLIEDDKVYGETVNMNGQGHININDIVEFKNKPFETHRMYEYIDMKRSNDRYYFLDFSNMGEIADVIPFRDEYLYRRNDGKMTPKQIAMINHVSTDALTIKERTNISQLIRQYHKTKQAVEHQRELNKYDKLYASHSTHANDSVLMHSLDDMSEELNEYQQELQTLLNSKSREDEA